MAAHVEYGLCRAMSLLMPDGSGYGDVTDTEYRILWLYSHLLKDFDKLPIGAIPRGSTLDSAFAKAVNGWLGWLMNG